MDELIHTIQDDKFTIRLDKAPGIEWLSMSFTEYELRRIFQLLVSHYCDTYPEVTHTLKGMVTVDYGDGIERIAEQTGLPKSSQWRGKKLVSTGKVKGARAWLNIGNYGICDRGTPEDNSDEDGDEDAPEDAQQPETLDRWL